MALDLHKNAIYDKKGEKDIIPVKMEDIVTPTYPVNPLELLGETKFGKPRVVPEEEVGTPIQEFYRDATVFITGGTGFMGKTLTEKLLRSCPHLKRIYLLIRPKKGKSVEDRLEEIYQDPLFSRLKVELPGFHRKISAIGGDIAVPDLGLSDTDRTMLKDSVTVVFHGAATVRFDEKIKTAIAINILGVQAMIALAREMKHLKSFVHISTAFTHCPRSEIDEQFYATSYDYTHLTQVLLSRPDDENLDELTRVLLGPWPNTYTFTKALGEDVIQREAQGLPVAMFRPSVIVSTYKQPVRGWIDNLYGPVGLMVGVGTGILHTTLNDNDNVIDMVPIDMVVNALLTTAWYRGSSDHQSIPIYNYVSSSQSPIKWATFANYCKEFGVQWPTIRALWYVSYVPTKNRLIFFILNLLLHVIPGLILDGMLLISGGKPILSKIYSKMSKASSTLEYFAMNRWTWSNENVQHLWTQLEKKDRKLFFFNMAAMDWRDYCEPLLLGMRVYLVKDGIHTLPAARRKWQKLWMFHNSLKFTFYSLLILLPTWTIYAIYTFTDVTPMYLVLLLPLLCYIPFRILMNV